MKYTELKNEEAVERLAEMLDPIAEIAKDKAFIEEMQKTPIDALKYAMKTHSKAFITLLALFEGIPREEFNMSGAELIKAGLELFSNLDVQKSF